MFVPRIADQWIWDSWIADDGELFHLFFLQAPRSLVDPDLRHTSARIGHATSTDLSVGRALPAARARDGNGEPLPLAASGGLT